jgi:uncharacterized protein (UPF0335 family)
MRVNDNFANVFRSAHYTAEMYGGKSMAENLNGQRRGRGRPRTNRPAADPGHNSGGMLDREALNRYVQRISALHHERKELNESIKDVYDEAKEAGFVTKIIREIVREYAMEAQARQDRYNLLDSYRHALGMLVGTPLGDSAIGRAEAEV